MDRRPRDVVVTPSPPGLGTGRRLRTTSLIRALGHDADVDVIHGAFDPPPPALRLGEAPARRLVPAADSPRWRRGARWSLDRALGRQEGVARGADRAWARATRDHLAGARRVIADGPLAMLALLGVARRRPVVYAAHNLESRLRPSASMRRTERLLLRACAQTWQCTQADLDGARELAGAPLDGVVVRNVVDVEAIAPRRGPVGDEVVLFVADFHYAPNRDALEHLLADVLGPLRARRPAARLRVVGRGLADPPAAEGLELAGFVEDLEAEYARADAAVVPLRWGSGSPLKLVEALAHGLPTVTTPHAAALVPEATDGRELLVGPDGPALAAALDRALAGEAEDVGRAARALAAEHYSIDALARVLAAAPAPTLERASR